MSTLKMTFITEVNHLSILIFNSTACQFSYMLWQFMSKYPISGKYICIYLHGPINIPMNPLLSNFAAYMYRYVEFIEYFICCFQTFWDIHCNMPLHIITSVNVCLHIEHTEHYLFFITPVVVTISTNILHQHLVP